MELIEIIKDISAVCVVLVSLAGGIAAIVKILNAYSSHKEFTKKCEGYEAEIKETNDKIDNVHKDNDAKLQEIRAEQEMLTMCMRAVLDGLHQLNCNGAVTEASKKLDDYLNKKAHA